MARTPHGMTVFIEQVKEMRKSAKIEPGDVDGLDAYRSLTFDKATSKWLQPILDEIDDPRIVGYGTGSKDVLTVVFTHRPAADHKDPYPLEAALTVAESKQ